MTGLIVSQKVKYILVSAYIFKGYFCYLAAEQMTLLEATKQALKYKMT